MRDEESGAATAGFEKVSMTTDCAACALAAEYVRPLNGPTLKSASESARRREWREDYRAVAGRTVPLARTPQRHRRQAGMIMTDLSAIRSSAAAPGKPLCTTCRQAGMSSD